MLTREQCRTIQKAGEDLARQAFVEAWAKEDRVAVELLAYGMLDIAGRTLTEIFGPEFAHGFFKDMAARLAAVVPPRRD